MAADINTGAQSISTESLFELETATQEALGGGYVGYMGRGQQLSGWLNKVETRKL